MTEDNMQAEANMQAETRRLTTEALRLTAETNLRHARRSLHRAKHPWLTAMPIILGAGIGVVTTVTILASLILTGHLEVK